MRRSWATILLLFTYSVGASAEESCKGVDYRPALGAPRSQDGTSWCYAHSTADLLSQKLGKQISSIDLATTYLIGNEFLLEKSKHPEVREYLKAHPDFFVRLHEGRQEEEAYKPETILGPKGFLDTGGKDDEAILLSNVKGLCLESRLPASKQNVTKYLRAIHDDFLQAAQVRDAHGLSLPSPIGVVESDVSRIMAHAFQKWVDIQCGKRIHPAHPILPHEVSVAESLEDFEHLLKAEPLKAQSGQLYLFTELNRVLDSGKVAAIAYQSFDLYPRPKKGTPNIFSDHSSVVAARKQIKGKCHYFVRNHYGPTCGYRSDYDDLCEKENGGVWVPADALEHLYSVISVR